LIDDTRLLSRILCEVDCPGDTQYGRMEVTLAR